MDPRDPDAPLATPTDDDEARAAKTVAELVRDDQLDPTTPASFRVELEPLELGPDDGG